ncbi:hypothetical protein HT031_005193 [Scenedesmus sp. PABB004]|nr:hypothetical protein HT031_005193 [Scenedesmus sp. PABB004]
MLICSGHALARHALALAAAALALLLAAAPAGAAARGPRRGLLADLGGSRGLLAAPAAAPTVSCPPGSGVSAGAGACAKCKRGTWSAGGSGALCRGCPKGYTTATEGAMSARACGDCRAGYGRDLHAPGKRCALCPAGTWRAAKPGAGIQPCHACPVLTTTSGPGTTSAAACNQSLALPDDPVASALLRGVMELGPGAVGNNFLSSWRPDADPCTWQGVGCTGSTPRVVRQVDLQLGLCTGRLPRAWGELGPGLEYLGITINGGANLSDASWPLEWRNLTGLKYVSIDRVGMTGPLPLAALPPSVESVTLYGNRLTSLGNDVTPGALPALVELTVRQDPASYPIGGTLPASWGTLATLQSLDLTNLALAGPLPEAWSGMAALTTLDLGGNALTGPLPASWGGGMAALTQLRLSHNALRGPLPDAWGALDKLTSMQLSYNNLTGPIPEAWAGGLATLVKLDLSHNALSGSLPAAAFVNVPDLDLSYNQLTGRVADWAGWATIVNCSGSFTDYPTLNLAHNQLTGPLPEAPGGRAGRIVLSDNALTSTLPAAWAQWARAPGCRPDLALELSNNQLRGPLPPEWGAWSVPSQATLSWLNLTGNPLNATLPPEWGNSTSLGSLDVRSCGLQGTFPAAEWAPMRLYQLGVSDNPDLSGCLPRTWLATGYTSLMYYQPNCTCSMLVSLKKLASGQDALSTAASGSPVAIAAAAAAAAPGDAGDCQPGEADQPMQLLPGMSSEPSPANVPIPPLPQGERPNILLIVTDDQGYDDVGLHNPAWVNTPHLDAFMRAGTRFDNFYTAPQCAQTRAELLTGRNHARTGVLLVHAGYDFVSRDEVTGAELLRRAGYKTAHFGKFHNHNIDGYMPWEIGYDDAWVPGLTSANSSFVAHNGRYEVSRGMPDDVMADKLVSYIAAAAANTTGGGQPFFATLATHGIHLSHFPGFGGRAFRFYPERYDAKYQDSAKYRSFAKDTRDVFAMANYLDSVLGKVLRALDDTGLAKRTLVLVLGDNGSSLTDSQRNNARERAARMPSKMVGEKDWVWEGGVRGWLAARGPGVPVGAVDSTLLYTPDIVPTLLDLARARSPADGPNLPAFDGKSFAAHLRPASAAQHATPPAGRFDARTLFFLSPHCWDADTVPQLGPDRRVLRPQPLLDFDTGGVVNAHESEYMMLVKQQRGGAPPGFARCIAVRHKDFKLQGHDGKVYRLPGASRVELGCNEVTGALRPRLTAELGAAARAWWAGLVEGADSHAFAKPVFYLGFRVRGTSILAAAAHERTPKSIVLLPNGARGFVDPGDRMCWAVTVSKAGTYSFSALHLSTAAARFRLSLGPFAAIADGSAPAVEAKLAHTTVLNGTELGQLELQPTAGPVDLCLELVTTTSPGRPVLKFFGALQAYRMKVEAPSGSLARSVAAGAAVDSAAADGAAVDSAAVDTASAAAWATLRRANGVPDGQPELLGASMYSPYDAEGIDAEQRDDMASPLHSVELEVERLELRAELEALSRKDLQALAKEHGVRANGVSSAAIVDELLRASGEQSGSPGACPGGGDQLAAVPQDGDARRAASGAGCMSSCRLSGQPVALPADDAGSVVRPDQAATIAAALAELCVAPPDVGARGARAAPAPAACRTPPPQQQQAAAASSYTAGAQLRRERAEAAATPSRLPAPGRQAAGGAGGALARVQPQQAGVLNTPVRVRVPGSAAAPTAAGRLARSAAAAAPAQPGAVTPPRQQVRAFGGPLCADGVAAAAAPGTAASTLLSPRAAVLGSARRVAPSQPRVPGAGAASAARRPAPAPAANGSAAAPLPAAPALAPAAPPPTPLQRPARRTVPSGPEAAPGQEGRALEALVERCMRITDPDAPEGALAGPEPAKRWLQAHAVAPLKRAGGRAAGYASLAVLLVGPSGAGKTELLHRLAQEMGSHLLYLPAGDLLRSHAEQGPQLLRALFKVARRAAPCVVAFDDAHRSFPAEPRPGSEAGGGGAAARQRLVVELAVQLQALADAQAQLEQRPVGGRQGAGAGSGMASPAPAAAKRPPWGLVGGGGEATPQPRAQAQPRHPPACAHAPVVVVLATRHPEALDPALLAHLPHRLLLDLPAAESREELLSGWLMSRDAALGVPDVERLARATEGYSCADLLQLCHEAALRPVQERAARALTPDDFDAALAKVPPSVPPARRAQLAAWAGAAAP